MVTIARSLDETQAAYERSRTGVPAPRWAELYFHSAYDPSVAPEGKHVMSVFAEYAPYTLAEGTWDERREAVADEAFAEIARFAPDIVECVIAREVLAPPDIERAVGLSGGHIFQGECLPDQMWDRRFSPRTPMPGLYLCGASTHPGGSVIAHQRAQLRDGGARRHGGRRALAPSQSACSGRVRMVGCACSPRRRRVSAAVAARCGSGSSPRRSATRSASRPRHR